MLLPLYLMSCARVHSAERKADAGARVRSPERRADAGALAQAGSGEGKKQVAAMLGVQTLRASTRPRPFLRLSPQHLAVQARPRQPRSHRQASCACLPLIYNKTLTCKRNKALTRMLRHMSGTCMHALSRQRGDIQQGAASPSNAQLYIVAWQSSRSRVSPPRPRAGAGGQGRGPAVCGRQAHHEVVCAEAGADAALRWARHEHAARAERRVGARRLRAGPVRDAGLARTLQDGSLLCNVGNFASPILPV